MRRSIVTVLVATAVTIAACAQDKDFGAVARDGSAAPLAQPKLEADSRPAEAIAVASTPPSSPEEIGPVVQDPSSMIIRTAQASIEVDSLSRAIAQLRSLALRTGGYVSNTSMQGGGEQPREASLELKVPVERFDEVRDGLTGLGKLKTLTEGSQDVGEEYVDIGARVANSRRLETRLLALLAARSGPLDEVLSVERELGRVRSEIERAEGRMRYLRARVAMSTITVSVFEPRPVISRGGGNVIAEAFANAWRNFVGFIAALIAALGFLIPLAGVIGLGWALTAAIRRRFPPQAVPPAPTPR
jgi:hypothetical protein